MEIILSHADVLQRDSNHVINYSNQNSFTKFRLNGITSLFILNAGGLILLQATAWLVIFVFRVIRTRTRFKLTSFRQLDYNLPIAMFYLTSGEIFMFISLQLCNLNFANKIVIFSVLALVGSICFYAYFANFLAKKFMEFKRLKDFECYT